mgnify:CR=1 FL=1|jgi:hypothetical protein
MVSDNNKKKKKRSEEKAERAQAKLIHCRIRIPAMDHQDGMRAHSHEPKACQTRTASHSTDWKSCGYGADEEAHEDG